MTFNIASLLPDIPKEQLRPKIRNGRQYVLSLFVEKLQDCKDAKGKPFTTSYYAYRLSHLSVEQLYDFYRICNEANCGFVICFFGALKTDRKPVEKKWLTKKWKKC